MKLHCSFCGKSNDEVAKLVPGPNVFICNECHASMADRMAIVNAAPPAPEPPPYDRFSWRFAYRKLVGENDGKPLAVLFRGATAVEWYKQIPLEACYALEELLDPHSPCNPFARPKLPPPDMMQEVDGKPISNQ